MKKMSLIFFTILSQMAVGAFWVLWGAQLYFSSRNKVLLQGVALMPLLVAEVIMLISLLVSLLHLGSPQIAYRAITNLRSSWLSREILFGVLFTGTSVVFTAMQFWQISSGGVRSGIAWLAAYFGLMLVYSMSRLYMVRTVPFWNTNYTLLTFFLTSIILGGLLVSVVFMVNPPVRFAPDPSLFLKVVVSITALVFLSLGTEFVAILGKTVQLLSGSLGQKESILALFKQYKKVFSMRLLIGVLGMVTLGLMIFQTRYDVWYFAAAFTLILLAELLDRYLFYTAREVSGI